MRAMESGLRAIARCLQVPDPVRPAERNWAIILRSIRAAIDAKWPATADRASGDGQLFDDLYASLDAVKHPWRNASFVSVARPPHGVCGPRHGTIVAG